MDEPAADLPDGAEVELVMADEYDDVELTDEQMEELRRSWESGRVPLQELLDRLRR